MGAFLIVFYYHFISFIQSTISFTASLCITVRANSCIAVPGSVLFLR